MDIGGQLVEVGGNCLQAGGNGDRVKTQENVT